MKAKKTISAPAAPSAAEAPLELPRFGAGGKLAVYPLCVLAPGAGFALGILYARQKDAQARRFGLLCLALAGLGTLARLWRGGEMQGFKSADTLTQPFY